MDKSHNKKIVPMEDEEDLEFLRLAALKTLHKKENVPAPQPPLLNVVANHTIPVLNSGRPPMEKYYPGVDPVQPNLIHHPVPAYVNTGFEKMDINEPYVPQRMHPASVDPFNGFSAFSASSAHSETNVQLSPRTAAFVMANKEIIKRRQGMSPSPEPYRKSPGRWSRSPSPESWKYRRSLSRSPPYQNHSPNTRNRSNTPPRRRHSPGTSHNRKTRSRSPIPRIDGNFHRSEQRSPNRSRENHSPINRNGPKWRAHSPHRNDGPSHPNRKSNSPRTDDANYRNKRRTRSPINSKPEVKRRSLSRSPNRKFARNNTNLRRGRRSPPPGKRFNANNHRQNPNLRNRNYNARRSTSPNRRTGSNLEIPLNQQKRKSPTNNEDETLNKFVEKDQKTDKNERIEDKKSETELNTNVPKEKSEQEIEEELLASSADENSDSDNDDDGIDLFASEESESENEGRFKLSSSKTERKTNVPTVSFSELGKVTAASADVLRDLDEVQTNTNSLHRKGNSRRENGRDRDGRLGHSRRHIPKYNEKRSYPDRDRNPRERENRSRKKDTDAESSTARSERRPISFKSAEAESKRKTPDAAKSTETKEKSGDEKKSTILVKRAAKNTEKDAGTRSLQSSIAGPITNEKQRSSPTIESGNGTTGKKPIHSRLGAMTTTWKPNKKSWKSEKV